MRGERALSADRTTGDGARAAGRHRRQIAARLEAGHPGHAAARHAAALMRAGQSAGSTAGRHRQTLIAAAAERRAGHAARRAARTDAAHPARRPTRAGEVGFRNAETRLGDAGRSADMRLHDVVLRVAQIVEGRRQTADAAGHQAGLVHERHRSEDRRPDEAERRPHQNDRRRQEDRRIGLEGREQRRDAFDEDFRHADRFVDIGFRQRLRQRNVVDRRFRRGADEHESLTRLAHIRALRITLHVVPVTRLGVARDGPAPQQRFAAFGDDLPDFRSARILGIELDEPLIGLERVEFDGRLIGFIDRQRAQILLGADAVRRADRRRLRILVDRLFRAEHIELHGQSRHRPRNLRRIRRLVDVHAGGLEHVGDFEIRIAHLRHEARSVEAVRPIAFIRRRHRRRREADEHAGRHFRDRETGNDIGNLVIAGRVDDDDLGAGLSLRQFVQEVVEAESFVRHVALGANRRVDRDQIVLARDLRAVTREVEERVGFGAALRHLVEKLAHDPAAVGLSQIADIRDLITCGAQRFADCRCVGRREWRGRKALVPAIADDQRDPRVGLRNRCLEKRQTGCTNDCSNCFAHRLTSLLVNPMLQLIAD